ncbi:class I SAM-dependent methyltransferase [Candidatus Pseudothioglobus singularis]|nr:class I SAM-dependent methyltransferase [Candidatus Pseudothioglobus singularis]
MSCYLCKSDKYCKRAGSVRDNSNLDILECGNCGLVYLSSLDHIQDEHYEESGMHGDEAPNIDNWLKETEFDDKRRYDFVKEKITNKNVLDFGCGAGGFLEMAKQSAMSVSGIELERALQSSFQERKLNIFSNLKEAQEKNEKYDIITAFHVVEHLQNPKDILMELSQLLEEGGEMIVEVPNSDDALLTLYENKAFQNFTYWSQHLFLFNAKTMKELIIQSGLKLNWIKHIQRYPLSNHLYWLSKGNQGGQKDWGFLDNDKLNEEYEKQLGLIGRTDTLIASMGLAYE